MVSRIGDIMGTMADQLRKEGEVRMMTSLLRCKFGEIPSYYQTQIERADSLKLLQWSEQIHNARTLEEVFDLRENFGGDCRGLMYHRFQQDLQSGPVTEDRLKQMGAAELLLGQLQYKFGPLPEVCLDQLWWGGDQELSIWSKRIFNAKTLEDIFLVIHYRDPRE